jgi:serine/threonine protein kinase
MTVPLDDLYRMLRKASSPEEVFGALGEPGNWLENLKHAFRGMIGIAHPDHCPGRQAVAEAATRLLTQWREAAVRKIAAGSYGQAALATEIKSHRGAYAVGPLLQQADYANIYRATRDRAPRECIMKIVREPVDNPLAQRELRVLDELRPENPALEPYLPELVDAFLIADGAARRQATVFEVSPSVFSAAEIRAGRPHGLDPRDAAWMFNRLLEALWFTHQAGVIHAAALPPNLLFDVENHSLKLCEWAFAVPSGEPLTAISGTWESWYPPEILRGGVVTPAADIFLAARCFVYLLGGNLATGELPSKVPEPLHRFIRSCLLPAAARRPSDAGELREEVGDILRSLYGPRTFRKFVMTPMSGATAP